MAFTSTDARAVLPPPATFTPADAGTRTVSVQYRTAGTRTVTATDTAKASVTGAAATAVSPAAATRFGVAAAGPASAGVGVAFTVTAFDAFDNKATGYAGTVTFTSTDPQATLPAAYTFTPADAGRRAFTVTFRTAGTQVLTATDAASGAVTGAGSTAVAPGPAARFDLGQPLSATAGAAVALTVTAFDVFGNVATGYVGTVRFTGTDPRATLPAAYTFTPADAGTRTFAVTYRTAGPVTVTVRDAAATAVVGTATTGVAPGAAVRFTLVPAGPATAGAAVTVTVTPFDAFGNEATNFAGTVTFTSTDPRATLPADVVFVPGGGPVTVPVAATFRSAGTQTLTATDTTNPSRTGSAAVAVSPGAAARFALTGLPAAAVAGSPLLVTLTAFDAFGNVATGYAGTVAFTATDPQASLPAAYTFTPADAGTRTFAVSFATAGSQTLTADDGAGVGGAAAVAVGAAAADSITVTGPTGPVVAGGQAVFTVVVRDPFGNIATGYAGILTFTSTDPRATLPAPAGLTGGTGAFAVTFRTAGSHTVTVGDGRLSGAAVGVTVVAGAAARFDLAAPPGATVGVFAVTVIARDAFGNVVAGYAGTVRVAAGGPPAEGTFTPADAGARAFTVTLPAAGPQTVTATDAADPAVRGEAVVAAVNPAPAAVTLEAAGGRVGRAFTLVVTGGPFVPGSVVVFGGQSLATTFAGPNRLEAVVPADAVAAVGPVPVVVRTPGPGGGESPAVTFAVTPYTLAPVPADELITPVVTVPFGEELGRFRADDPTVTAADLTATIDWGDGTIEQGQVVALADGSFAVVGSHTYPDTLSYLVTVTVRGPGGVEVAAFRFAVVSTPSGREVLGVTRVVLVPAGAATGSVAVDGVRADFARTSGMDRTLLIRVSRYTDDPADRLDPAVVLAGAYDVQLIGAIGDDRLTVTFEYDAPPGVIPRFQFFNAATGQYEDVAGDPLLSDSLVIDPARQVISVVFTADSMPAVTGLLGTVFVVTVPVAQQVPTPVAAPARAGAPARVADLPAGDTRLGATRLISAVVVGNAPTPDAAGGDPGPVAIIGGQDGAAAGTLPFLPADELSLTVRPSQDEVLAPGDPVPPGEAAATPEDVLLGPYLPEGPPAAGAGSVYLRDGVRPRLRVFRDLGLLEPAGEARPTPQTQQSPPAPAGAARPAPVREEEEGGEETSAAGDDAEADRGGWWWAGVAVAVAVGARAAVPSAVGGRPRFRLGIDSADAD